MREDRPKLDIVLVNWNAGDLLRECLASIPAALDGTFQLSRVVVVDNASTDDSLSRLAAQELPLQVIRNPDNRGFGAACNQGARQSDADYLLFLNPDTRLFERSLGVPMAYMSDQANEHVGVCGVQLVDGEGRIARSCARFLSAATFLWIALGVDRLLPGAALSYRMTEWDHAEDRDVDHVMGAFYLMRAGLFAELGGFDEDYFVYFEDIDLSRRVHDAGYRSRYLATAQAFHLGGGTSRQVKARRLAYFLRGKLRYARKHTSRLTAAFATTVTLVFEPLFRCLGALVALRPSDAAATLGAYALLWRAESPHRRSSSS